MDVGSRPLRRGYPRALIALVGVLIAVVSVLVIIAPPGHADTPEILLGRNRMGEFQGVRGDTFLAWQQNTTAHPRHFDVYARPIDGGTAFKVNARGTNAAIGGIDGDLLVYQEFQGNDSDLRFYDLSTRTRSNPPPGVNTSQWEYWPSISGDRLLFGRLANNSTRRIVLFDLSSETARVLDKIRGRRSFMAPGQVNGEWATWSRCRSRDPCEVIRYNIPNENEQRIPNPGRSQYAPSIAPDGTVYFARGRNRCGNSVRLFSFAPGGGTTELWRLPNGDDVGTTRVYVNDQDRVTLLFDQFDCDRAAGSDVWRIVNPDEPPPPTTPPPTSPPPPSEDPTPSPSEDPTPPPSEDPTPSPTEDPTPSPTEDPTPSPTEDPTPPPSP